MPGQSVSLDWRPQNLPLNKIRINYPDGGRQHVKAAERDRLLVAGLIVPNGSEYRFVGQVRTFHALSDLAQLKTAMLKLQSFDRWPGPDVIVVAPDGRQWRECGVESPYSTMTPARLAQVVKQLETRSGTVSPL